MAIKVVFLDCDGTLTTIKSSWEFIHRELGIWDNNAEEYQRMFRSGEIDYDEFCRRDAALWRGLPLSSVMEIVAKIPYQRGAEKLVRFFKERGIFTVVLSTGLSFLVDRVKQELGIDMAVSNELIVQDGILTGDTRINVTYGKKGEWVKKILNMLSINRQNACAVGDGEGDVEMFKAVSLSIGFDHHDTLAPYIDYSIKSGNLLEVIDIIEGYNV
ncbi:MAG: HAD-IB family phosphatase [Syntrophorhabdaceae bacterium]|nr:HAD-IB family phosphatase [Syntrophorhabdaceae bacterium]